MLAGPVFEFELLTTARRGRYYLARSGYALVLLIILWQMHVMWAEEFGRVLTPRLVSRFAHSTFAALAVIQVVLVLVLTPALVAGVIASEKQSKTLHYVMATPLSGIELVLGKLLARMLHVGIFLAVGFPILSMLVLLGGVDPRLVVLGCAVAAAIAFFLAALSVLVSVHARTVREALFLVYSIELLWLLVPELLSGWLPWSFGPADAVIHTVNEWLLASSPVSVGRQFLFSFLWGSNSLVDDLLLMAGLQFAAALALVALAAWRLRPVFRKQADGLRLSVAGRGPRRVRNRVACGDNPMDWKERRTSRGSRLTRIVGVLVTIAVGVPMIYGICRLAPPAFGFLESGYYSGYPGYANFFLEVARHQFHAYIQVSTAFLFVIGVLGVAASSAASITSEHEGDTWLSLTSTDLTPCEVVFTKMAGSVWMVRRLALASALLLLIGIVSFSVSPLALVTLPLVAGVFLWFAAALGIWISLQFQSTWRAQFLTIATLFLMNLVGQLVFNQFTSYYHPIWPGFMPTDVSTSIMNFDYFRLLRTFAEERRRAYFSIDNIEPNAYWSTVFTTLSVVVYTSLAAVLTWSSIRLFDKAAGRPVRSKQPHPQSIEPKVVAESPEMAAA